MITLTPEEEAILRPEYDKYISGCILSYRTGDSPLSFDAWWREKADNVNED